MVVRFRQLDAGTPERYQWLSRRAHERIAIDVTFRVLHWLVMIEAHVEDAPAARKSAQISGITKHLCERHQRGDDDRPFAVLVRLDPATSSEITDEIVTVPQWCVHLYPHYRFEQ